MIKSFRKRKFINHKKRILYVSLFFLLLLISIGYAYISTSLSINGVSTIAANSWNIHFENLSVSNGSSVASTPATIQNDTTKINYSVLLDLPGDFYEFEVDVVNSGTIPGKVSLVNISGISSEAEPYLESSVKYVNGRQVQIGDILNPGTSKRIVVRVGYIEDLNTFTYKIFLCQLVPQQKHLPQKTRTTLKIKIYLLLKCLLRKRTKC